MNYKNLGLLVSRLEKQLDSPEAARFNMAFFGNKYMQGLSGILQIVKENPPVCNTQACLAGETVLATGTGHLLADGGIALDDRDWLSSWEIASRAKKDLGLTEIQADKLFFFKSYKNGQPRLVGNTYVYRGWPEKFQKMYEEAKTPQGRLYAAIRRVEHFIKTEGRE